MRKTFRLAAILTITFALTTAFKTATGFKIAEGYTVFSADPDNQELTVFRDKTGLGSPEDLEFGEYASGETYTNLCDPGDELCFVQILFDEAGEPIHVYEVLFGDFTGTP